MTKTLREWRLGKKLTQDQLAAKSGVDQTHISSIEIGRRVPSEDVLKLLAKALGIAPSKIQFTAPEPSESVDEVSDKVGHTTDGRQKVGA